MMILLGILGYIIIGQIYAVLITMEVEGKYRFNLSLHLFMGVFWPLVIF